MSQQLYILRHAEPDPWSPLGNDFSRSLDSSGSRHALLLADWMTQNLETPDTIFCSPAKRTRETLAPILAKWAKLLSATDYVDSMYGASLDLLLALAEDAFSYSERLLIVGHNPGVSALLANCLNKQQATGLRQLGTGTLAVVEFSNGFKREARNGQLLHLLDRAALSVD